MGSNFRTVLKFSAAIAGFAIAAYTTYFAIAFGRYGDPVRPTSNEDGDPFLDRFMPRYEVVDRHHIHVSAPAGVAFRAACESNLMQSPIVQAIFKTRELILRGQLTATKQSRGLRVFAESIGWGVLSEVPNREIVMGAVTQPWQARVVFRPLPPGDFLAFNEPDFVKIVWTLRVNELTPGESVLRTETRAIATDQLARTKFRRYWSFFSPGIVLIRWLLLSQARSDAESQRSHFNRGVPSSP